MSSVFTVKSRKINACTRGFKVESKKSGLFSFFPPASLTLGVFPPFKKYYTFIRASLMAQRVKRLLAIWETWVQSLGREDPLEKEMATHSRTLAWKIPWIENLGEY